MKARDLMSTNLAVVPPETPVAAVAELLAARGISGVPVVDEGGAPLGLVTESDLIQRLAERPRGTLEWFLGMFGDSTPQILQFEKAHGKTARDVMSSPLHMVGEETPAAEIARLMERNRIRRVPVVKEGRLVGIVSRADLLRALLQPAEGADTSDEAIRGAISGAMARLPWADAPFVFIDVKGAEVTLHGFCSSPEVRQGLKALSANVPGVKAVHDAIIQRTAAGAA